MCSRVFARQGHCYKVSPTAHPVRSKHIQQASWPGHGGCSFNTTCQRGGVQCKEAIAVTGCSAGHLLRRKCLQRSLCQHHQLHPHQTAHHTPIPFSPSFPQLTPCLLLLPEQVLGEQAAAATGAADGEAPPLPPQSQRRLMRILRALDGNALEKLLLWESYLREEGWEGRSNPRARRLLRRMHAAIKALDAQAVSVCI